MKPFTQEGETSLNPEIVQRLIETLDEYNELVKIFRTACDKCSETNIPELKIQLYNVVGAREYQLPTSGTLGAIIIEDGANSQTDYDVIVEYKDRHPKRINKLHSSYISLQFPLLFIYGQPGYNIKMEVNGINANRKRKKIYMNEYYAYQLHERFDEYGHIFRSGRLFQQYFVSVYCALEQDRLDFIRAKQNNIRSECLAEIKRRMQKYPGLTPADRANVVDRVFEQKVSDFIKVLKESNIFGRSTGVLYTIEFQKRGLPHCHTLLWIDSKDKIKTPEEVDKYISAKLPNEACDPQGYRVVDDLMMLGPCGNAKPSTPCMQQGTDRIATRITKPIGDPTTSSSTPKIQIDEIKNFIDGRFICPNEAFWRILKFPIHHREPPVQILAVHLQDMQMITFRDKEPLGYVLSDNGRKLTTLAEWFTYNQLYDDGKHLTYLHFPSEFVWYENSKRWSRRQHKNKYAIGHLAYVHPGAGELFYFRMLLAHQKGCTSFVDVRTVNNKVFPTYRAACQALGLLDDDKEWDTALQEAALSATASELRSLFAHILLYCEVADPLQLWEKHWRTMADDMSRKASHTSHVRNLHINDPEMKGYIIYEIEMILNGCSRSVQEFGFSLPPQHLLDDLQNRLLMEEKNYNREELKEEAIICAGKLNEHQKAIYDLIVSAANNQRQELVFVYGHSGTGKTFLWKTIINKLRLEGKIVLAVASSGIASLLLPSGRTTHSRFKLPLELTDETMCNVKKKHINGKIIERN